MRLRTVLLGSLAVAVLTGCAGTRAPEVHLVARLHPDAEQQCDSVRVDSSGTWRWASPNFLLAVRHVDDEALNKRFPEVSFRGSKSANPFTYGNWLDPELGYVPPRFTVFEVAIHNRAASRVRVDVASAYLKTDRGDSLRSLSLEGPEGLVSRYQEDWPQDPALVKTATELAKRALLGGDWIQTSGNEGGYVVFSYLDPAVYRVTVFLPVVVETEGAADTVTVKLGFKQKLQRVDRWPH